ncbi:F-box protein SKIP23-like protein [Carex littledalei]|uniref:F-box protein SKIP23-like protein n=1 Tax=Carex littledalei TaxID=544730 RepID=A0A833RNV7_9POAL|nr:F-box protein SKIP23-like protein [Carex littledalei]
MGYWSKLPSGVLEEIAERLSHRDLAHFGAVCKFWRLLYFDNLSRLPKGIPLSLCYPRPIGAPILLLSCKPDSDSRRYACSGDESVDQRIYLPEAVNKWICGSNWGWLVMSSFRGKEVSLLNPLTRCHIRLPSLEGSFCAITKAIISLDPTSHRNECIVMAIIMNCLWFCKIGGNKWTKTKGCIREIQDVVFYQEKFYAVTKDGSLVSYCGKDPNAEAKILISQMQRRPYCRRYLVASAGGLLQVLRVYIRRYKNNNHRGPHQSYDNEPPIECTKTKINQTFRFEVMEFVESNSSVTGKHIGLPDCEGTSEINNHWSELESLHDQSLFLGYNTSLSEPASLCPSRMGNRIYFTDDHHDDHVSNFLFTNSQGQACHDSGVFNFEDKSLKSYHPNDPTDLMPSVWVTPNPW